MSNAGQTPKSLLTKGRILEAAQRVIKRDGLEGLTHRSVAREADVSLGLTTYHFTTLSDLRRAAVERSVVTFKEFTDAWYEAHQDLDPSEAVMTFLRGQLDQTDRISGESELYIAAIASEDLRPVALEWSNVFINFMSRLLPRAGLAVSLFIDGLFIRTVLETRERSQMAREGLSLLAEIIAALEKPEDRRQVAHGAAGKSKIPEAGSGDRSDRQR